MFPQRGWKHVHQKPCADISCSFIHNFGKLEVVLRLRLVAHEPWWVVIGGQSKGRDLLFWVNRAFLVESGCIKNIGTDMTHDPVWLAPHHGCSPRSPYFQETNGAVYWQRTSTTFMYGSQQARIHRDSALPVGPRHSWEKAYGQRQQAWASRNPTIIAFPNILTKKTRQNCLGFQDSYDPGNRAIAGKMSGSGWTHNLSWMLAVPTTSKRQRHSADQ